MPNPSLVTIPGVVVKFETDRALLVVIEGEEFWVPKSLIDDDSSVHAVGTEGDLVVPLWFAQKEEMPV